MIICLASKETNSRNHIQESFIHTALITLDKILINRNIVCLWFPFRIFVNPKEIVFLFVCIKHSHSSTTARSPSLCSEKLYKDDQKRNKLNFPHFDQTMLLVLLLCSLTMLRKRGQVQGRLKGKVS